MIYSKVLVTGATGFLGRHLCPKLKALGCELFISNSKQVNLLQYDNLRVYDNHKFDYIFHLAAQAIVSTSYSDPVDTISTNVIGTLNILEALRTFEHKCIAVMITSDKCYDNVEWVWGYRETDHLGGKDVYSGSKGAAELVIKSYISSFFHSDHPVKLAIGRAGNVIGGGDWAADRIIVDCMRAWSKGDSVDIRSPKATRPWQHVLEPLSGYLILAQNLYEDQKKYAEGWNFGPNEQDARPVDWILDEMISKWPNSSWVLDENPSPHEADFLKLDISKAKSKLGWSPVWELSQTLEKIINWHQAWLNKEDMQVVCLTEIKEYMKDMSNENN